MSAARHPWWLPAAALLGSWFARLLAFTWRFDVADAPSYTSALAAGERFVYTFWHSGLLPLALYRRDEGIAVLVSRHHDGELVARLIERLGYVTARGSSTRGGEAGVRELLAWAERGRHLAFTPDGPRGPAEEAKEGAVYVAERTGMRVVPIAVGVRAAWVLRSWDRFRVPRPFARVVVSHGEPLTLAPGEAARDRLQAVLTAHTSAIRTRAGETP